MKKTSVKLLSAVLLLGYGFTSHKPAFLGLGLVFALIALAEHLKK